MGRRRADRPNVRIAARPTGRHPQHARTGRGGQKARAPGRLLRLLVPRLRGRVVRDSMLGQRNDSLGQRLQVAPEGIPQRLRCRGGPRGVGSVGGVARRMLVPATFGEPAAAQLLGGGPRSKGAPTEGTSGHEHAQTPADAHDEQRLRSRAPVSVQAALLQGPGSETPARATHARARPRTGAVCKDEWHTSTTAGLGACCLGQH